MKYKNLFLPFFSLFLLLIILEGGIRVVFPNAKYIIPPSILLSNYQVLFSDEMFKHIIGTLLRTIIGFGIVTIVGISFGVLFGKSKMLSLMFQPIINIFRSIPSSILIPLLISIPMFGLDQRTHYFTIIFGSIWPILINTTDGVRDPHPTAVDTIRQLQLSKFNTLRYFTLPQAATLIFSGMKVSLSICLILSITAEIIVGIEIYGLGYYQEVMGKDGNYILMYMITIVVAGLGFMLNLIFEKIGATHPWLNYKKIS